MKRKDLTRLIDTIFAVKNEDEMLCTDYFEKLPTYLDLKASGRDPEALMPEVRHHMHQCPECEEVYLAICETLDNEALPEDFK